MLLSREEQLEMAKAETIMTEILERLKRLEEAVMKKSGGRKKRNFRH